MEFFIFSQIILPFFFIFIVLKLGNRYKSKCSNHDMELPPCPLRLPFIGNMHLLVGSLPHHALRDLATKYGPLMYLKLGEVMKTHDITFASRPELLAAKIMSYDCTDIAFSPYGEYWRQVRKICISELLSPKRVQSFRSLREEETYRLAIWLASNAGSTVNLTEKLYSSMYTITSRAALGKKTKDHERFICLVQEGIKLAAGFDIADVYPSIALLQMVSRMKSKVRKLHGQTDEILENIINEHKAQKSWDNVDDEGSKQEDLVDVLLKLQENGLEFPLTIDNIKSVILDVFTAGSETSATTVDWAMSEMLRNPRILKRAQDEVREVFNGKGYVGESCFNDLNYLKLVIKETLRLHPPLPLLLPRKCSHSCKINGYDIPLKSRILVNAWAIGRDPKVWEDAESFIPERFLDSSVDFRGNSFEYIPFGAGRRICPGISFGLANVELPLAIFLYHFDWSLPHGMKPEELDMSETYGVMIRRKDDLKTVPIVKIPLPLK